MPHFRNLVRVLFPYGAVRRVLFGPVRGWRYVVEPGMGFSYAMGFHRRMLAFLAAKVRPGMTVYDIGANRGQMALFFARVVGPKGRVLAFEPAPEAFGSLRRNVELNRATVVEPRGAAVGDREGTAAFHFEADRPTEGFLTAARPEAVAGETFNVEVTTIDAVIARGAPPPDVMKIDVEGAAAGVLRGAAGLLDGRAPAIYIELHGPQEQAAVRDELIARGYVVETLDGSRVPDPTAGWFDPLWCHRPAR